MLAHGGHSVHAVVERAVQTGWQQRGHLARRRAHAAPALARLQLRVGPQVGHVVDTRIGNPGGIQAFDHLGDGKAGEYTEDQRLQRGAVGIALRVAVKAGVGRHFRALQHGVAKDLPLALVLQAQHHRAAISCQKRPVGVDAGVRRAGAWWRWSAIVGVIHRVAHPLAHGFQHGHVDMAALARLAAQQQGRQDVGVGIHACGNVGHRDAGFGGRLGRAGDGQEPRLALDQQVVGLFVAVGAIGAITADVADDELGVVCLQGLVRQPHARGRAGCEVLHQHVGRPQELQQRGLGLRVLHVERQAFLVAVEPGEVGRLALYPLVVAAREVAAAGALHLDDARAQVGQLSRAERRGDRMFERNDGDAVEGAGHGGNLRKSAANRGCARPRS